PAHLHSGERELQHFQPDNAVGRLLRRKNHPVKGEPAVSDAALERLRRCLQRRHALVDAQIWRKCGIGFGARQWILADDLEALDLEQYVAVRSRLRVHNRTERCQEQQDSKEELAVSHRLPLRSWGSYLISHISPPAVISIKRRSRKVVPSGKGTMSLKRN